MVRRRLAAIAVIATLGVAAVIVMRARHASAPRDLSAKTSCVDGPTTPGIDVSYHQDRIQWRTVRRAGIRFAFIRVSDGLTVSDPRFRDNWEGARDVRVLRGAYQFFRPEQDPRAQADLLIDAIWTDPGELAPVIDVENTGGRSPAQVEAAVRVWIERVRQRLGVEPIVYTSPEFWRERVGSADLSSQPLWVAHYTGGEDACPRVPSPWTRWTFWQHSKTGAVAGIRRDVDLDWFAGSIDDLRRLADRRGR